MRVVLDASALLAYLLAEVLRQELQALGLAVSRSQPGMPTRPPCSGPSREILACRWRIVPALAWRCASTCRCSPVIASGPS